ncbi:MAG TPA: hypothetical protein ENH28_04010 [Euryarchaeota archaeon]|nr:uridylate kinase [archaeon BMS3Bbin15]HDL15303.1 hypothetical protein [Euryarchaeota archaeon]
MKVIKIGGSLIDRAEEILKILKNEKVLIIPGGGVFADAVRDVYKNYNVGEREAHFMAIMAMNIFGIYLEGKGEISAREEPEGELPAILLPYRFIKDRDELPPTWDVTGDSITCYIGAELNAEEIILLKSVDGVFGDGGLINNIAASDLEITEQSVVDSFLPEVINKYKIRCRILNGREMKDLNYIFKGDKGTCINPDI